MNVKIYKKNVSLICDQCTSNTFLKTYWGGLSPSLSSTSLRPGESWSGESQAGSGEGVCRSERWPAIPRQRQTGRGAQEEEGGGPAERAELALQRERAAEDRARGASLQVDCESQKHWQINTEAPYIKACLYPNICCTCVKVNTLKVKQWPTEN